MESDWKLSLDGILCALIVHIRSDFFGFIVKLAPHGLFGTSGVSFVCRSDFCLLCELLLAVHRDDLVETPSTPVIAGWVSAICELSDYSGSSEFW